MRKRRFFIDQSFVIDQEHDERVWATLDEGCNAACHSASWAARADRYFDMFGFRSEYREGTRNKVFTGLGGNTVAAVGRRKFPFALAFTAERGDIHHLSGTMSRLTPQLLRASKPMYALAATIPLPTCLTGGATASGEHVDILRSLTLLSGNHVTLHARGNLTRRHGRIS